MNISVSYKSDEEFEAINGSKNILPIDMLPASEKKAFSPTELLLSAVAACAAVDIVSMIKKRRKTFVDLKAETSGTRKEEHPRGFSGIDIRFYVTSPDITEKELERIIELATTKYCSVADSLNKDILLNHSFEIIRE